jgi:glycosyltransferase involved in cell wall biosynthesis
MNLGQFIERKGCWVLLEALKQIREKRQDLTFVWITTSMPAPEILAKVEEYRLEGIFRILSANEVGPTRDDLLTLLSSAGIFVLPSLQEGLPIALVEAMALGLPCIASEVNAIPEAIENEISGVLVPPGDAAALCDAIIHLVDDKELRTRLSAKAKDTAFTKFNEHHVAERMMELYEAAWKSGH